IAEDSAPLADRTVGGDQHATALVAARDELEEVMGGVRLERQIAELVDDEELGLGEEGEPLLEPALAVRLGEAGDQRRRGDEENRARWAPWVNWTGCSNTVLADHTAGRPTAAVSMLLHLAVSSIALAATNRPSALQVKHS